MSLANKVTGLRELWHFDNKWHLIVSRLFFPREKINIYKYKGLEILTDHSAGDANGAREVLTSPMYRQYLAQMEMSGKPVNILDIGSNNGGFPLLLKSEGVEIKKLACVEMNPRTFSRLSFNIARNFDCESELINGAVCGRRQTLEVQLGEGSAGDSLYEKKAGGHSWKIQGHTFDDIYTRAFGDEEVALCKIDIEGAEFDIFTNPGHETIKKCRYILMEIHQRRGNFREEIRRVLSDHGFSEIDGDGKNDAADHVHFFRNARLQH
jgi:FkbM family methyltransferase